VSADLQAARAAAAEVLAGYQKVTGATSTGEKADWADRLACAVISLVDAIGPETGPEPYCVGCGEWVTRFPGRDGWHHFTGGEEPGSKREPRAAEHEVVIGWIEP
jgi:hypothetical protein